MEVNKRSIEKQEKKGRKEERNAAKGGDNRRAKVSPKKNKEETEIYKNKNKE